MVTSNRAHSTAFAAWVTAEPDMAAMRRSAAARATSHESVRARRVALCGASLDTIRRGSVIGQLASHDGRQGRCWSETRYRSTKGIVARTSSTAENGPDWSESGAD